MSFQRKKPAAIGIKAHFPGFIEPALATPIEKVPSGQRWLHEIKFDGYRVQLHIANDEIKVPARQRLDEEVQEDRGRRLPDQRGLRDHRRRDRGALGGRQLLCKLFRGGVV
jgi:hypothetical protein